VALGGRKSIVTLLLLLIHLAATWYMVGLCWLVQRVQYPLMALVGNSGFQSYETAHIARISPIVAPPMLLELTTGIALTATAGPAFRQPVFMLSLGILFAIWVSTFALQVPLHNQLTAGFDAAAHTSLVSTNWLRTLGWSLRGLIVLWTTWSLYSAATA
jgi:hypothetical protein